MGARLPHSPARLTYLDLLRVQGRLAGEFEALFKDHGLSSAQFNVLRLLLTEGETGCQELGRGLLHRVPDVTRLLDRMERAGLVHRRRSEEDRRRVLVRITPKGRRACERLYGPVAKLHEEQFAHVPRAAVERLDELLRRVLHRPGEDPPG